MFEIILNFVTCYAYVRLKQYNKEKYYPSISGILMIMIFDIKAYRDAII